MWRVAAEIVQAQPPRAAEFVITTRLRHLCTAATNGSTFWQLISPEAGFFVILP